MNLIQNMNVENKKVILRCDLNVTIKNGQILSDEKIIASLETINYLLNKNAKVIIMSHLGRVETEADKKDNSLLKVHSKLFELLPDGTGVYWSPFTRGSELESLIAEMKPGEVLLMENTRFEDINGKKESKNDSELAKYWASLGDIFINDAFGMTHRRHASNNGIAKYLPNGIGFLIQKEINGLEPVINPEHPFVVIMSGAKVADKIDLMANILKKCDYLLLGGGIAHTFNALKYNMGKSLVSEESLDEVKKLLQMYPDKIIMPTDGINETEEIKPIDALDDQDNILDIGPETIKNYAKYINLAKTIFLNGAAGVYEDDRFASGTKSILELCAKAPAKTILGGGDALASAEKYNIKDLYFMSTGGGATLDYIGSGKLNCLE